MTEDRPLCELCGAPSIGQLVTGESSTWLCATCTTLLSPMIAIERLLQKPVPESST